MSTTLRLNPAVAAARRAARKAASGMAEQVIVQQRPSCAADGTLPATQEKSEPALSNKAAKKQAMRDLQRKLKATWGHLFSRNDIPLAIGIRHDIAKHLSEEEQKVLPGVLHQHTHRPAYINALTQPGAHRVALDGSLEPITAEQRAHAQARLNAQAGAGITSGPIVQQRATVQAVGALPVRATTRRKASA